MPIIPIPDPAWSTAQWVDYLRDDLRRSVFQDIAPLLQSRGYFGIPRQVFCYVDYLGSLWSGPSKGSKGKALLATTKKAEKVLADVFARVDVHYGMRATCLVAVPARAG